jgi:hypothetical protein
MESKAQRIPGRPWHTCKDIRKTDLKDTGQKAVDQIHITQERDKRQGYVDMVMNLWAEDSSLMQCYAVLLGKRTPAYPTMYCNLPLLKPQILQTLGHKKYRKFLTSQGTSGC